MLQLSRHLWPEGCSMALEIGDIIVWASDWPGHVGMVYSPGTSWANAQIIHAQGSGKNFHVDSNQQEKDNSFSYLLEHAEMFRAPWGSDASAKQAKQVELICYAEGIRQHATYGRWRAVRLFAGS